MDASIRKAECFLMKQELESLGKRKIDFSNPGSEGVKFSPWVHAGLRVTALSWHWAFFERPFLISSAYSKTLYQF